MTRLRLAGLALVSIVLAALWVGCGGKNPVKPPNTIGPSSPVYPVRATPDLALAYYAAAWQFRDSSRIDTVVAAGYSGASVDQLDPSSGTLNFLKSDEVRIVANLARDAAVSRVSIDLHAPSTWTHQTYVGDPAGWVAIQVLAPAIEVSRSDGFDDLADDATFMEFKFEPTTPASDSPTDTLWRLVRWTEVR